MSSSPRRFQSFFVRFYLTGYKVSLSDFIVPAETKRDAEKHVLKMIDDNDPYIPKLWDRYRIQ